MTFRTASAFKFSHFFRSCFYGLLMRRFSLQFNELTLKLKEEGDAQTQKENAQEANEDEVSQ